MIHEIAEIDVISGQETEFEAAVAKAERYFKTARGCQSFALGRSVENPHHYRLTVGWDSVEDHMVHFRNSPGFQAWRDLVGGYFATPPRVQHFVGIIDGFGSK